MRPFNLMNAITHTQSNLQNDLYLQKNEKITEQAATTFSILIKLKMLNLLLHFKDYKLMIQRYLKCIDM